jgi:pimeloyl-ACP methyl ester carboxylesterase
MRRASIIASTFVLCCSFLACSAKRAPIQGEWAGELIVKNDWQLLQLHLSKNSDGVQGTLDMPLLGATDIRLKEFRGDAGAVSFLAPTPLGDLTFEGKRMSGEMQGSVHGVQTADVQGTFHLARIATIDPAAYAGGYEAGQGHLIAISPWPEQSFDLTHLLVQYCDTETGRFGSLFPISETKFVSGGPLARIFPIELEVTFERNARGEITGLTWQEKNSTRKFYEKKTSPYREETVTFRNKEVTLAGTLVVPLTKGPHPAMVFTHGSGPQLRQRGVLEQLLVRKGFAVLTYDKRGMGGSTGDWKNASFEELADDAVAGAQFIKSREDIDQKQIGFWGLSQGGWIAPLAASRFRESAFVITASGGGLSPERQELLDTRSDLQTAGFSANEVAEAIAFQTAKNKFMRTGQDWDAYSTLLQKEKNKKWYGFGNTDAWGPDSRDDSYWAATRSFYFYDPATVLERLRCPALFVFGELDTPEAVREQVANVKAWSEKARNQDVTVKVFKNAGHNLFVGESDYAATITHDRLRYAPGYLDLIVSWASQHARKPN